MSYWVPGLFDPLLWGAQQPGCLTTGLPLVSGRLSTALFSRAAERGGLSAREVIQPLDQISSLLLPCVLQTRHGGACILLEWNEDRSQGR